MASRRRILNSTRRGIRASRTALKRSEASHCSSSTVIEPEMRAFLKTSSLLRSWLPFVAPELLLLLAFAYIATSVDVGRAREELRLEFKEILSKTSNFVHPEPLKDVCSRARQSSTFSRGMCEEMRGIQLCDDCPIPAPPPAKVQDMAHALLKRMPDDVAFASGSDMCMVGQEYVATLCLAASTPQFVFAGVSLNEIIMWLGAVVGPIGPILLSVGTAALHRITTHREACVRAVKYYAAAALYGAMVWTIEVGIAGAVIKTVAATKAFYIVSKIGMYAFVVVCIWFALSRVDEEDDEVSSVATMTPLSTPPNVQRQLPSTIHPTPKTRREINAIKFMALAAQCGGG